MISVSALLSLVSAAALLMVLGGGHGTENANLLEGFVVMGVPPLTVIAGIGLLRRTRWAYAYVLVLLGSVALWNISQMLRGPTPQRTYTSPSGVPTTVLATAVDYPFHIAVAAVSLGLLAKLLTEQVRTEFRRTLPPNNLSIANRAPTRPPLAVDQPVAANAAVVPAENGGLEPLNIEHPNSDRARGWRVGHQGRDEMYYEERTDGGWQRIRLSGELLTGRAHHVIYFDSPEAWLNYPEWARHRRDEIIARIKSVFRAPDYEYQGDGHDRASPPPSPVFVSRMQAPPAPSTPVIRAVPRSASPSGFFALLIAIAVLWTISGVMGWLVTGGITNEETYFPTKRPSQRRMVNRAQEPALYWVSIGLYAIVGTGTFGLGAWGVREAIRLRRG